MAVFVLAAGLSGLRPGQAPRDYPRDMPPGGKLPVMLRRNRDRPRLSRRFPQGPRRRVHRSRGSIARRPPTLRPAPRRRVHLAQRQRKPGASRRVGRALRRRAAAHLRQVHRQSAGRGKAANSRSDPANRDPLRRRTATAPQDVTRRSAGASCDTYREHGYGGPSLPPARGAGYALWPGWLRRACQICWAWSGGVPGWPSGWAWLRAAARLPREAMVAGWPGPRSAPGRRGCAHRARWRGSTDRRLRVRLRGCCGRQGYVGGPGRGSSRGQ